MTFIDYSIAFSHSTLLSLVLILIFPLVERFKYEPLARETGRTLPTSSAINKVHSLTLICKKSVTFTAELDAILFVYRKFVEVYSKHFPTS